jgi:hypothetical protein
MPTIRAAHSILSDPAAAAQEFHERVLQPDMALVLFFCSSRYDLDALAGELNRLFDGVPLVGCTTAGEIGSEGCQSFSLSGASFPAGSFSVATGLLGPLEKFEVGAGKQFAEGLKHELVQKSSLGQLSNPFAFLMIDGLSQREEPVLGAIHSNLPGIPIIGGSAGDNLRFRQTFVFGEGRFRSDHAVLVLVDSDCPVALWKSQHFVATDQRMVITEADAASRRVIEINGLPAAPEYARLTGVNVNDLDPGRFASSPVVVLINGEEYVRSIQKVNDDGSLTFYCAIESGLVIRVAKGVDLYDNLEKGLQKATQEVGQCQAVFACDCVLRRLELEQTGTLARIAGLLKSYQVTGFNSYGEQIGGVHVNQTFTAIAIGHPGGDEP